MKEAMVVAVKWKGDLAKMFAGEKLPSPLVGGELQASAARGQDAGQDASDAAVLDSTCDAAQSGESLRQ